MIAAIEDPDVARKILECLKLPARAPPLEPAAASGALLEPDAPDREGDWDFDQRAAHDDHEPF